MKLRDPFTHSEFDVPIEPKDRLSGILPTNIGKDASEQCRGLRTRDGGTLRL